jgi:rhodanese-related sulfurtransferase
MKTFFQFTAITLLALPAAVRADIGPSALAERLANGESIALIDVRANSAFTENHIPGALNMPERIFQARRLPSSRAVVIYDDGLGRADASAAVAVARQSGRQDVTRLRGGLAAWESAGLPTTGEKGFRSQSVPLMLYDDLVRGQGREVTLLDLREEPAPPEGGAVPLSGESALTDLATLLPQARVVRPGQIPDSQGGAVPLAAEGEPAARVSAIDPEAELIVVIDNGDGAGEEVVRRIRASGNRRVVLLAGGERILSREGRPGLERRSLGIQVIDASQVENREEGESDQ